MRKDEVLKLLAEHKPELVRRFGITDLALFGSTVRNEARTDSDIDVLAVSMGQPLPNGILVFSFIWKICWAVRLIWLRTKHCVPS
jgi:predicted nucleotidyltransferase